MGMEFINRETGVEPDIAEGVSFSGVIDCIYQVKIGKDSFSGHNVALLTGGHNFHLFGEERKASSMGGPIIVGEGVWIGSFAIIIGPCSIGDHSVIGAGAVISKDVPSYELWVGNPAFCLKKYDRDIKEWQRI